MTISLARCRALAIGSGDYAMLKKDEVLALLALAEAAIYLRHCDNEQEPHRSSFPNHDEPMAVVRTRNERFNDAFDKAMKAADAFTA